MNISIKYSILFLIVGLCILSRAHAADRYIIKYKQGWDGNTTSTSLMNFLERNARVQNNSEHTQRNGGRIKRTLALSNAIAAELSQGQLSKLQQSEEVDSIELDPKRFIFQPVTQSTGINLAAEIIPYGLSMIQADQVSDVNTGNIKICIADTGYDGTHEDLRHYQGNITGNDNNGSGSDTGNWWQDGHGHGTHVAGIISALGGNGIGVAGVNPSNQVGLHIVKVFNNSGNWAYGSDMIAAIEQCINAGAKIMSMSLGGALPSNAERNAFQQAYDNGMLLIAAAGNNGTSGGNNSLFYPAAYDAIVSVAAINSSKNVASWSQKNSQVEVSAPGVDVTSTMPGNTYSTFSGTSMATPHASALAALVWSHFPDCSNSNIRSAINASAEDLGSNGRDQSYGYGLVQAANAYNYLNQYGCSGNSNGGGSGGSGSSALSNGQTVASLTGSQGDELGFYIDLPAGATNLKIVTAGGSGDVDLYVREGAVPTTGTYDCRPYNSGNNETCTISSPNAARYHIMLRGYSSFSAVKLTASFEQAGSGNGGGGSVPGDSFEYSDLSANSRAWLDYKVEVPTGMTRLNINIAGGSGDADLYIRFGSNPTSRRYDCRPYLHGNDESCEFTDPDAGTWYIRIKAYQSFSGVMLSGSYE